MRPFDREHEGFRGPAQGPATAAADLPSEFGDFRIHAFTGPDGKDHIALVHGEVAGVENVPVRVHSECLTGDVLGSLRCDCRPQLEKALRYIASQPQGIVLYLRQEGRGIGLLNKINAYQLQQQQGLDTVDANLALGFADDLRDYSFAANMLQSLQVGSILLMTNNPNKVEQLEQHGVKVAGRLAHEIQANPHNHDYLRTKTQRSGHLMQQAGVR